MKLRTLSLIIFCLMISSIVYAQDANTLCMKECVDARYYFEIPAGEAANVSVVKTLKGVSIVISVHENEGTFAMQIKIPMIKNISYVSGEFENSADPLILQKAGSVDPEKAISNLGQLLGYTALDAFKVVAKVYSGKYAYFLVPKAASSWKRVNTFLSELKTKGTKSSFALVSPRRRAVTLGFDNDDEPYETYRTCSCKPWFKAVGSKKMMSDSGGWTNGVLFTRNPKLNKTDSSTRESSVN